MNEPPRSERTPIPPIREEKQSVRQGLAGYLPMIVKEMVREVRPPALIVTLYVPGLSRRPFDNRPWNAIVLRPARPLMPVSLPAPRLSSQREPLWCCRLGSTHRLFTR